MTRAGAIAVVACLAVLISAGCSGVPGASDAVDVRQVAGQVTQAAPAAPLPGQQPDQIVRGFVAAAARPALDASAATPFDAARQFLSGPAQQSWQTTTDSVLILADGYRTVVDPGTPGTVTISGTLQGVLDPNRSFTPRYAEPYTRELHLSEVDGEWRIDDPPPELLVTAGDAVAAFRQRTLYFLDETGTVVVPDPRYLTGESNAANRADRLMRLLLRGPSEVLQGAARSELGADAELRSNPSIDADGVLRVDLTGVDVATPADRRALAAQIVWTLSPTAPRIAISVEGEPLDPEQLVYTLSTVSSFDPDRPAGTGTTATDAYYVDPQGGILALADGRPLPGRVGDGSVVVTAAAMAAATGSVAAVVQDPAGGASLLVGRPTDGNVQQALRAETLTSPSFTRSGEEAWTVQNGATAPEVYRVATAGAVSRERVGSPEFADKGPVSALALSPDGVRVAVVAGEQLYLGKITQETSGPPPADPGTPDPPDGVAPLAAPDGSTPTISDLTLLRPELGPVGAIAFSSSTELTIAASPSPAVYRTLWRVSIDGRDARPVTARGIFGDVDALAVSPVDRASLIAFGGRVWQLEGSVESGQWGTPRPGQPSLSGSAPFYPR